MNTAWDAVNAIHNITTLYHLTQAFDGTTYTASTAPKLIVKFIDSSKAWSDQVSGDATSLAYK